MRIFLPTWPLDVLFSSRCFYTTAGPLALHGFLVCRPSVQHFEQGSQMKNKLFAALDHKLKH